jgi:repressor LexA
MRTSQLTPNESKGLAFIHDSIIYRSQAPSLQKIANHLGFKSRRSSALLIEKLIAKGYLAKTLTGSLRVLRDAGVRAARTIEIPLVGSAPCGIPMLAEENIEALIPVSQSIARPGAAYFLLRAIGNSMNRAGINDGDLVIVRQQPIAHDGDRVVALIDDSVTIKELRHHGSTIMLVPRSTEPVHQPIILERDFLIQGVVLDVVPYPKRD